MVRELNPGIFLTPLNRIPNANGDILHALKLSENTFYGFGEAYFSMVQYQSFKGWKKHSRMILNLVVPIGMVRFYIIDDRSDLFTDLVDLSPGEYSRLTIPPGVWLGFEGLSPGPNLLLNIASVEHDPLEAENKEKKYFAHLFNLSED